MVLGLEREDLSELYSKSGLLGYCLKVGMENFTRTVYKERILTVTELVDFSPLIPCNEYLNSL